MEVLDFDIGLANLKRILSEFPSNSEHWNEAQNRFHFIDRLLKECLGWGHPEMDVEVRDEKGKVSDYHLGKPVRAILEAKREAVRFSDLPKQLNRQVRRIPELVAASSEFKSTLEQVIPYCAFRSAPIAVVCNGPQMAVFQAITGSIPPMEGECFFFDGFDDYVRRFELLWKLLSPSGVADNFALRSLTQFRNPAIPQKASNNITEPTAFRYRNNVQENLRDLSEVLLGGSSEDDLKEEFYRYCYVPIDANNRHLMLSKNVIASRYSRVSSDNLANVAINNNLLTRVGGQTQVNGDIATHSIGAKPVVVIGDVGVGKTSFFENLYFSLKDDKTVDVVFLHINLGDQGALSSSIKSYVVHRIPELLYEKHGINIHEESMVRRIYKKEIERFDEGVVGRFKRSDPNRYEKELTEFLLSKSRDDGMHLKEALKYLSVAMNKLILIIVDNSDQRSFDDQQEAFLVAQELSTVRELLVFVSLRPSTFYKSKLTGALSGYQNRLLTIGPPAANEVLEKRITFALRIAEGKVSPKFLNGIRMNLDNIAHFLSATLRSIKSSRKIKSFLNNVTGGNTRMSLELMTSFCGSPNVDAAKIVEIEKDTGEYVVPLHEFTKHALLGEYSHFNPQSSQVACNVFDVSSGDCREHFLKPLVIAFLSSNTGKKDKDGYINGGDVVTEMLRLGFSELAIRNALRKCAETKLIETPVGHYREVDVEEQKQPDEFHYRSTSVGNYHIRQWIGDFEFLDAVSIDTPIFDEEHRRTVFAFAGSFVIEERNKKTIVFKSYLERIWNDASFEVSYFDFPQVLLAQKTSFESVEKFLSRKLQKTRSDLT